MGLAASLALAPVREAMEADMSRHMLVQYPLVMLAGSFIEAGISHGWRRRLMAWNALGISGLVAVTLIFALLMIPRVLDLSLVDLRVEWVKLVSLLFAGAALRVSWRAGGLVVQTFFLGNVLPMMIIVGMLYLDSPVRLCNAYGLDDQRQLGLWLIWLAIAAALAWCLQVARRQQRGLV